MGRIQCYKAVFRGYIGLGLPVIEFWVPLSKLVVLGHDYSYLAVCFNAYA